MQASLYMRLGSKQGRRQRGGSGARPLVWNRCLPFHGWPTGCCIHPILYFKNVAPPSGFWPPLLLHPGDGPGSKVNIINYYSVDCISVWRAKVLCGWLVRQNGMRGFETLLPPLFVLGADKWQLLWSKHFAVDETKWKVYLIVCLLICFLRNICNL